MFYKNVAKAKGYSPNNRHKVQKIEHKVRQKNATQTVWITGPSDGFLFSV
jgi:hypothetical protein